MKIGITCYPTYGGSGAVATELGLALAERGHEVHFVSYAQPFRLGKFRERVFFHEVEMEDYPLFEHPPYTLALAVAIYDVAVHCELDLMHVHYAIPHATSAWLAAQMLDDVKLPVVTTLHGTDITLVGQHPTFSSITRFSLEKSDALTAVSQYLKDETIEHFGVRPEQIEVIPNFIDPELYRRDRKPCHRSALAEEGERIIMHISNFRAVKRVPIAVEAFARIVKEVPSRLILVGDGPDRAAAEDRARALGVADRVVSLGKHDAVHELLACADLFLLPSSNESFGLAALEAMACGVPVVCAAAGGLPEVVPPEAGALVPVDDPAAMAEAGTALLSDPILWRTASDAARARAVERFTTDRVVPMYEAVYRRLLQSGPDGPEPSESVP